jgi:sugar/nucleoside kinase (ribokinase family)
MSAIKHAVVAGHICLDVIPNLNHIPPGQFGSLFQPGHLITAGAAEFSTGGPVSNTGLALHLLGIPTKLIAKVGPDAFGGIVQDLVEQRDATLTRGIVVAPGEQTSYTIIISPPDMDRIFLHCPGANDTFTLEDIDFKLLDEADLFHFGYPPIMRQMYENGGETLAAVFQHAKIAGVTTSLDMAFPDQSAPGGQVDWRNILSATLPNVDIFTPSIEEILFMLHRQHYEDLCSQFGDVLQGITPELLSDMGAELLEMGAKVVLLKLGHQGAYLRTTDIEQLHAFGRAAPNQISNWADQELWSPCYQVDVVGTTGSGDATIAGFLSAILRELAPKEALNAAVAVGACNVEALDALSGLRSWQETITRVQRGWTKYALNIDAPGWVWDDQQALWSHQK